MTHDLDDGATVRRFRWVNVPAPVLDSPHRLAGRRVAVCNGTDAAAESVSVALARRGAVCWRPGEPGAPDAIVDLTLPDRFDPRDPHAADKAVTRTLALLRHCYPDWAEEVDARRLAYLAVTYLDGESGYRGDPIYQPLGGLWAGLAKTLPREIPNVNARVIDVARPDLAELADLVAAELYARGPAEIGYRDGVRRMLVPRPEPVAAPTVTLTEDDVVLVCGGGTGIGFELARALAREHGCRVVVTGRAQPPVGTEDWLGLDEAGFEAYRQEHLRAAAGTGRGREVRGRLGKLANLRALQANLRSVAESGLPLRYSRCDHADPADLDRLLDEIGPPLAGVVYLAGVDRPARLPKKSDIDFLAGISVKVTGFLRLVTALRERKPRFLCASGSLTGRLGGMVGELDYAAANEALARIGLWAKATSELDVLTVCWPLWRDLSVSSNMDAALKYMPAMDPAEGLARWNAELLAPHVGEAAFLGPIGPGVSLAQAGQFTVEPGLPGFDEVYPKIFHRGEPLRWRPGSTLIAELGFSADTTPIATDFLVHGDPALPVTILLENVLRSCAWLVPEQPRELTGITVNPAGLRLVGGTLALERRAEVDADGRSIAVSVHAGDTAVARLTVRYGDPREPPPLAIPASAGEPIPAPPGPLRWRGAIVRLAQWRRHPGGTLTASVQHTEAADVWAAEPAPEPPLPISALENILRMTPLDPDGVLRIDRLVLGQQPGRADLVLGDPSAGAWCAIDRQSGRVALNLRRSNHRP
ncbi:KR domain-containing protein [Nocardia suismassiliense]|uniref:KR domain-containing protein n=1 Tax=Nocardia suismassiliense TaxID=2077092 RepID=UPI000D1D9A23|nr:KR domain-containing protein [Nocardia suismassiliense]